MLLNPEELNTPPAVAEAALRWPRRCAEAASAAACALLMNAAADSLLPNASEPVGGTKAQTR
jgi:hypothetical protein